MNKKATSLIAASALIASGALVSACSFAQDNTQPPAQAVVETSTLRTSAAARTMISSVREARFALFDGQVELAEELVKKANASFNEGLAQYAVKDGELGYVIPVDSGLSFSEGFQPNEQHAAAITQAGELMQNGDIATAVSVMNKAGVELDLSAIVIPVASIEAKFQKAMNDISSGDFYAANLTLKTIESAVESRHYNPGDLPRQGYSVTEIFPDSKK